MAALAVGVLAFAVVATAGILAAPTAITGTVSAVGGTSATLNGTVNPGGLATDWWFELGPTTSYGTKTATTAAGSGSANVAVARAVTGLGPATTYHYRLVARSSGGTTYGADGLFTTASPPTAVTGAATGVGPTGATVGGTVDPNGQPTTWWVEYGTSTSYGSKTGAQDAGSGTAARTVSAALAGLATGKTYHFRLVAQSAAGTTSGQDATFVTAEPPTATTRWASSIGSTSARLNGRVDPNGRSTTYLFEYGTTTSYGSRTSSSSAGSGTSTISVSKNVSGLRPGTVYHFRIVAVSDVGVANGADLTLTTMGPPTVVTGPATAVGPTTASLGGTVNPNGRSTSVYVEYGTTTRYGSRTSSRSAGSGTGSINVAIPVSGLAPGTTYHFRLVASSALGASRGADAAFSTLGAPSVVTGHVDVGALSLYSARVNATVNPRGSSTTWWFEYGRTRSYGLRSPTTTSSGTADIAASALLTGLAPGRRWHFRIVAQSAAGTSVGRSASFGTPSRPREPSGRLARCTIVGTQGPDVLRGGSKRDVLCGLGGDDRIVGGGGADSIYGGPGDDFLDGGVGNDVLRGGVGDDDLYGRSGNDLLDGSRGSDLLVGGTGRDRMLGGRGVDAFLARDGRADVVDGGLGRDTATLDRRLDRVSGVERRRFG
jgi:phosphodiesterase/alkaline phosphatase D-like protein